MLKVECDYNIKEDIGFILESEKINNTELSERTKVSRTTLEAIEKHIIRHYHLYVKKKNHVCIRLDTRSRI